MKIALLFVARAAVGSTLIVEIFLVWCLACELGYRLGKWRKHALLK